MTRFVAELFASWVVTSDLTLLGLFGARPKQSRVGENGPNLQQSDVGGRELY